MVRTLSRATPGDLSIACLHHGRVLVWNGRLDEARPALEESAAIAAAHGPPGEQTLAQARTFIGLTWTLDGKHAEGEPYLRDACAWWAVDPAARDDGYYAGAVRTYADCLLRLGRADEAERVLLDALSKRSGPGIRMPPDGFVSRSRSPRSTSRSIDPMSLRRTRRRSEPSCNPRVRPPRRRLGRHSSPRNDVPAAAHHRESHSDPSAANGPEPL